MVQNKKKNLMRKENREEIFKRGFKMNSEGILGIGGLDI